MVRTEVWELRSQAQGVLLDLTDRVHEMVRETGLKNGIATVFVSGSTAGISTIEYENGLLADFKNLQERWIPEDPRYRHNDGGRDDNAHSHLRATMMGPSVTIPFSDGKLHLGVWQQIVLADFDTRPRARRVTCQVMGE
ncbi:MAG: secondary thiamine-phosphate synthase enzyme YjbQ [Candidatus Xenobia bacterium]